jgi:hypothetical protein
MANNTGQKFGGRNKGTSNKDTAEIRNSFKLLIENNLKQLEQDLKGLEPIDRIKAILELAKFVIPLLKATEITEVSTIEREPIKFVVINPNEVRHSIE